MYKLMTILYLSVCAIVSALTPQEIYKKCEPSIVEIRGYGKTTDTWTGTGVCIAPGVILTNCHITADAFELKVSYKGAELKVISVIEYPNHFVDLAVIAIDSKRPLPIDIGKDNPEVGAPVYSIGNPRGFNHSFTCGTSNGIRNDGAYKFLFYTAISAPGSSGGACINSEGKLVGITCGFHHPFSLAIPLVYVQEIIDTIEDTKKK
jgi:serine protease Do